MKNLFLTFWAKSNKPEKKGFTVIELMISTVILSILLTTGAAVYTNFFNSVRNIKSANFIYEEARFVMERIVKEVRSGTIDYEEYYNQSANFRGSGINETYGQNYCQYSRQFYAAGPDGQFGTYDDESTGVRNIDSPDPLETPIQEKLYLTNIGGTRRTYIKRSEALSPDGNEMMGKVAMLKLEGKDYGIDHILAEDGGFLCTRDSGEKDGLVDTWMCESGFQCFDVLIDIAPCQATVPLSIIENPAGLKVCSNNDTVPCYSNEDCGAGNTCENSGSFLDITPDTLDVVDLKFFITPSDDPHKAYANPNVQIQPHVTIKLIARASPRIASEFKGETPTIILESTVSARSYKEIVTECNLQECISGPDNTKDCPKYQGVCAGLQQECIQSIWPGCFDDQYRTYAGLTGETFGDSEVYQNGSEFASCGASEFECKQYYCNDGLDNDCDGLPDSQDSDCLFNLCNNGHLDPEEECIDVGGVCYFRPKEDAERIETCFDGYDNDCDYDPDIPGTGADEFDQDCIKLICENGVLDPVNPDPDEGNPFLPSDYEPKNYLKGAANDDYSDELSEDCIDIGGLCENHPDGLQGLVDEGFEIGPLCYDGWDNDCDWDLSGGVLGTGADEFDVDCLEAICDNDQWNCDLASSSYETPDYLINYSDNTCVPDGSPFPTDKDERCTNIGGICQDYNGRSVIDEDTADLCHDGLDNDCADGFDGDQDENSDPNCCPNTDGALGEPLDDFGRPYFANNDLCDPDVGYIDCDDSAATGATIYPGAEEVCDDATYQGHPVFENGTPIDNNCSDINDVEPDSTDDGWDHSDPDCCDDDDLDGFGKIDFFIGPGCSTYNGDETDIPAYDCYDLFELGANSYPGAPENTTELCTDGENNNCRIYCTDGETDPNICTGTDRKDHIDMYAVSGGISQAAANFSFEPDCCNLTAMELCDDHNSKYCETHPEDAANCPNGGELGSDEDCNGLEGFNDHFCLSEAGDLFHDNLTSTEYIFSMEPNAQHSTGLGQITLANPNANGGFVSRQIPLNGCDPTDNSIIIAHDAAIPGASDISYQFSNDGGATYCGDDHCLGDVITSVEIGGDENTVNFGVPLANVIYRAVLAGDGANSPTLSSVTVSCTEILEPPPSPPEMASATAVEPADPLTSEVTIVFNEPINITSATFTIFKKFSPAETLNVTNAVKTAADTVQLTTDEQEDGTIYVVEVDDGLVDLFDVPINPLADSAEFDGNGNAPEVLAAIATDYTEIRVTMSEPVVLPASNPENSFTVIKTDFPSAEWNITNATVFNAVVILTVDEMLNNANYTVAVGNLVEDPAGNPINPAVNETGFLGLGSLPQVTGAVSIDTATVEVTFDDNVYFTDSSGFTIAETIAPFTALNVTSAAPNGTDTITLTTDVQSAVSYKVTVGSQVKDNIGNPTDPVNNNWDFNGTP